MPSPDSQSNVDIPKIQLESKEDVLFLQKELDDYLAKILDGNTALRDGPLNDEQREEARQLVLENLKKWTSDIWEMAGQSMTINGFSYEEAMREKSRIEPLDESLKFEVQAMREEADNLLLSVTEKRRTVPSQIQQLAQDSTWRESVVAESTHDVRGHKDDDMAEDESELPYVDGRVNSEFESALKTAKKMSDEAGGSVAKMQQLESTLKGIKERTEAEADEDKHVRQTLLGNSQSGISTDASTTEGQHLLQKAALHAISQGN
ncbi:hypothetical protein GGI15_002812 [Coemansia interrupta]|uniref:Uncharacterized protein n=1 Tax=Coemansia interrupta TaxID=1126814 RepID=A0A9W8HHS0_9FUNG|nr:hypothetical protein GGI15_002812 [Coemansia interrupta]